LEEQSHIFEFISRVDQLPEEAKAGRLGFGLWWVKTFVDRFGGQIQVESVPEQGSTFTVSLPSEQGI